MTLGGLRRRGLRALAAALHRAGGTLPSGPLRRLLLEQTWGARSATMLDRYLVSGYQNPRINVQSILLRHDLAERVLGALDPGLVDAEIRFAIDLNETLRRRAAELGVRMGSYLNPSKQAAVRRVDEAIADREHEFAERWRATFAAARPVARPSVLELACGSANDYRAFVEYGLAAHIDYTGVDLTAKNIANARRRFPDVAFEVGDARRLSFADGSFDVVVASDLFEHLSLEDMDRALGEAMRLARQGLVLTFFNMADGPEHEERPTRLYHWNRLSRARIENRLHERFRDVRAVRVARWLEEAYGYPHSYNRHAVSIMVGDPVA